VSSPALRKKPSSRTRDQHLAAFGVKEALFSSVDLLPFWEEKVDMPAFKLRPSPGTIAVEVKVLFRELRQQLEERLRRVELYEHLPEGESALTGKRSLSHP